MVDVFQAAAEGGEDCPGVSAASGRAGQTREGVAHCHGTTREAPQKSRAGPGFVPVYVIWRRYSPR